MIYHVTTPPKMMLKIVSIILLWTTYVLWASRPLHNARFKGVMVVRTRLIASLQTAYASHKNFDDKHYFVRDRDGNYIQNPPL